MTNFRPVPLTEHAVFKGRVYRKQDPDAPRTSSPADAVHDDTVQATSVVGIAGKPSGGVGNETARPEDKDKEEGPLVFERELPTVSNPKRDPDRLVPLIAEVVVQGHSALVFCATRKACETCAQLLMELLPLAVAAGLDGPQAAALQQRRLQLLSEMRLAMGAPVPEKLEQAIMQGARACCCTPPIVTLCLPYDILFFRLFPNLEYMHCYLCTPCIDAISFYSQASAGTTPA